MNKTRTFIIVVSAVLYIAGVSMYIFKRVFNDQSNFVSAGTYTVPEQQAAQSNLPNMQSMQSVAHTFKAAPVYKPATTSVPVVRGNSSTYSLPTYSGNSMRSYGTSAVVPAVGATMVSASPVVDAAVPTVTMTPLAYRTTAVRPTQVAPQKNRMLAQGRAQAVGNYTGLSSDGASGSRAQNGPMKAPGTLIGEGTWNKWLEEYYGTGATDLSGLEAWWNSIYGGNGYGPDVWGNFWDWVNKQGGMGAPLADGIYVLLFFMLGYVIYKKRTLIMK